jgi:hypothetical protein
MQQQSKSVQKQYINLAIYRLNKQAQQIADDATRAAEWLDLQQQMLALQDELAAL